MANGAIRTLFMSAGIFEALFGGAFLVVPAVVYDWFGMPSPIQFAYVRFPAALVAIFGLMFFAVANDPRRNRNLIPYGILFKLAFVGVVAGYWLQSGLADFWKPLAVIDALYALLFFRAWRVLGERAG